MAKKKRAEMTPDELERERAYHRAKYQEHKAKRQSSRRARYRRNPEPEKRRARAHRQAHPEQVKASNARLTARRRGAARRTDHTPRDPAVAAARAILRDAVDLFRELKRNYDHLAAQSGVMPARLGSAREGVKAAYRGVLEAQSALLRVQGKTSQ